MLQQTQVGTVIKHYDRFLKNFPSVFALQAATQDEVLQAWHGLGYYRRALNMHKTAAIVVNEFAGEFPKTLSELCSLPGIGRSTAGSLLSSAWNVSAPILDANVRRVLSRYHGVNGPPATGISESELWRLAEAHTDVTQPRTYNQAIMDFGALWCMARDPQCARCPLSAKCVAHQTDRVAEFPARRKSSINRSIDIRPCVIFDRNFCSLLRPRGPTGIYASMWDTPELASTEHPNSMIQHVQTATQEVRVLVDVSSTHYRISNKRITEKLSIVTFNAPSSSLNTPMDMQWSPFYALDGIGLSTKTMRRIELAKSIVESQ